MTVDEVFRAVQTPKPGPGTIVVGVDGSHPRRVTALQAALRHAARRAGVVHAVAGPRRARLGATEEVRPVSRAHGVFESVVGRTQTRERDS